jgi:S1-C subfamily serine protease
MNELPESESPGDGTTPGPADPPTEENTPTEAAGWVPPPPPEWAPPPPSADWTSGWRDPGGAAPRPPAGPDPGPYGQWQMPQGGWPGAAGQGGYGPAGSGHGPGPGAPPGYGPGGYGPGGYGGMGPGGYGPGGVGGSGWYGWAPAGPRRSLPSTVTALLLVVAVLVGLGIGHGVWTSVKGTPVGFPNNPSSGGNSFNPFGNSGNANGNGLTGPAQAAAAGVVDIDTALSYQNGAAAGTGIVLSGDGYILTNNHVISGATTITATAVATQQKYPATVVGYDRTHDVAVLKLQGATNLPTANIGDSGRVSDGQAVVGLGNAGGIGGPPTSATGQVTALGQSIKAQDESNGTTEQLTGLIQTDCNIQPGDSGGPLVDSNGRVIGMDTAASTGFSFETDGNQGFAIPINQAISIANQIRASHATDTIHIGRTAFLGVEIDTSQSAASRSGAVVSQAIGGGAAAAAGITHDSVITNLGGNTVDSPTTLTNLMSRYHPGDHVSIQWTDATGQAHSGTVTLADGPAA